MPFVGGTVPAASSFRCDDALLGTLESRLVEQRRRVRYCPQTKQDIEIAFQTFGDISNPCVLLVMGLNGQGIVWEHDFCEMLAAKGPYFVIRYDNRDVGLSTKFDRLGKPSLIRLLLPKIMWRNDPIPYTLSDMAHDGICLLDATRHTAAIVRSPSRDAALRQLTIPSLVIHGDSDLLVPVENGYLTAKLIPKSRLVIRQGMGHSILPDDFQWIVEEIDDVVHRSAATPA